MIYKSRDARLVTRRKSADQVVNNSIVLQDDNDLFFSVPANSVWLFEARLKCSSATTTPDLNVQFTVPVGGAVECYADIEVGLSTNIRRGVAPINGSVAFQRDLINAMEVIRFWGQYIGAAAGGTFQLQWCQKVATAEDTKVLTNSTLWAIRVA